MPLIDDRPDLSLNAIVYATDFAAHSQNAGFYAALCAKFFAARLLVAHAFIPSQAAMEVEAETSLHSRQRRDLQLSLSKIVAALASPSMEAAPVLREGSPERVIPALADEQAPSLLVLGTHGGGRMARELIGSVAEEILRSTRWPAITVGPRVRAVDPTAELPFHHILYATDLTPASARAAVYAVSFAETLGANVDVLHVAPGGMGSPTDPQEENVKAFYAALEGLVPGHASEFYDAQAFVEAGGAHKRILKHIQDRGIDLLVLGIRKTSHLGMKMRTSGAFQLMVDATCPVLTVTG